MTRYHPDAFPKGPRTGKTPVRGNISPPCIQIQLILARYACYVSKKTRKAPLGNAPCEHLAAKGRFRRPKPSDHARRTNLATLRWPCPCAWAPARAAASRDRPSTAWPLPRGAHPGASPIPATCQYPPLAVPVAARGKPPMGFGGGHSAHGLQFGQAPRDHRLRHLDGQADIGMLRRTGPGFQNREQVGAEPPAEAAGPAGPASALPKTPIERTSPSWRNYRNTPKIATKVAFLGCPWPSLRQSQFHQPFRSCARSSRSINATQDFSGCHLTSSRQSFSRLCRSVSQHRCRVGLSWAALAQFALGPFEIYWSCLGS